MQTPGQSYRWSSAPFYLYSLCSLSNIMSSWFNFESLKLVSFTTIILFKGSKILPVMLMDRVQFSL